jgi:CRP/FNR family transcriptional regulator
MKSIDVERSTVTPDPGRTHVLARPFRLISDRRATRISAAAQTASIQFGGNRDRAVVLSATALLARTDIQTPRENTMACSTARLENRTRIEDVLEHLPISGISRYGKGQRIYGPDDVSTSIHLVITGTVGISQIAEDGRELLIELIRPDELFGESAFLGDPRRSEQATAIERTELMTWAVSEMEALVTRRPPLAVALLQLFARRNAELTRRIESLSIDTVERRLARSLIRLSDRLGTQEEDGSVRMMPFTHGLLSRYVGTTREIVTQHMNHFRKQGYVSYSRQGIRLHRGTLKTVLDRPGVPSAQTCS